MHAKLPTEEGGLLVNVLKELGDQIAKLNMGAAEQKSVSAETLADISPEDPITFPQRRADSLVALSEHYFASCTDSTVSSLTSSKAAERCQLVLHVRDDVSSSAPNTNLGGRWLLPDAARLACDAGLLVVKEDSAGKAVHFRERLCFSTVDRYFDSPFSRSKDFVIAANPAKFTCACCDFSELEKCLADDVSEAITATTAVTKWTGEIMDLSMAVDRLLWASGGRAGLG